MNTVSMKIWDSRFELGDAVSEEQLAFFNEHGVIVFRNFLQNEQVATYIAEQQRLEAKWLAEKKEKVKIVCSRKKERSIDPRPSSQHNRIKKKQINK